MKQYYVVYASKDMDRGYYSETVYWVVCVTEDEDVAKDLCKKFDYGYSTETVGEAKATDIDIRSREPREVI